MVQGGKGSGCRDSESALTAKARSVLSSKQVSWLVDRPVYRPTDYPSLKPRVG